MESFSIGALVKMTGISADTIRTWERRYGVPKSLRNEAGHRRYDLATADFLVMAQRLLDRGRRPSEVLLLSPAELRAALDPPVAETTPPPASVPASARAQEACMSVLLKVEQLDGPGVDALLEKTWTSLGPELTTDHVVIPLLEEVGNRWEHGRLGVHHEHLFSASMRQFLGQQWRSFAATARGPMIAMATPIGEEHELGLHLAALHFAMAGARILFLGPFTPAPVLLAAAAEARADALALSLSSTFPRSDAQAYIDQLRRVYARTQLIVGGAGGRHVQDRVERIRDRAGVSHWLEQVQRAVG